MLVVVQGELGRRPAGPEIRGHEIARRLGGRDDVAIAASVTAAGERDGVRVVPRTRRSLLAEAWRCDVIVAPLLPPYLLSALALRPCVRVADLYDPVDLEVATLADDPRTRRTVAMQQAIRRFQLRWSDVVVCANEAQRARALADLGAAGRVQRGPALVTVPMGVPEAPEPVRTHPLRDDFGFGPEDPVVLWWGSVWRWLDAVTAIRAISLLVARWPAIRLVITAGRPSAATDVLDATRAARAEAAALGLLGRNVFLYERWIPYADRHEYLGDADLGLTLHGGGPESALAARARYMDYVWASLPSVLAHGDEVAAEMARAGAAWLVPPGRPTAVAAVIEAALADRAALVRARAGCRALAARYRWSAVLEPLVAQLERCELRRASARGMFGIARDSAGFYRRRLIDSCLGTA